ncbi:MAG: hypothetical protein ACOC1P_06060 [Minisyncoccales bacterium]
MAEYNIESEKLMQLNKNYPEISKRFKRLMKDYINTKINMKINLKNL